MGEALWCADSGRFLLGGVALRRSCHGFELLDVDELGWLDGLIDLLGRRRRHGFNGVVLVSISEWMFGSEC